MFDKFDNENKKEYTIRLYKPHDLDLITFIEFHKFNVVGALYSALSAFLNGEAFVIQVPPLRKNKIKLKSNYRKRLILDIKKDAGIIELLEKISDGYRNNFFKNLLRLYLCMPVCGDFLKSSNDEIYFETRLASLKEGRRVVRAGRFGKRENDKNKDDAKNNMTITEAKSVDGTPKSDQLKQSSTMKKNIITEKASSDIKSGVKTKRPTEKDKTVEENTKETPEKTPSLESLFLPDDDTQSEDADFITSMFGEMIGLH